MKRVYHQITYWLLHLAQQLIKNIIVLKTVTRVLTRAEDQEDK
jgi:hypothetical protein